MSDQRVESVMTPNPATIPSTASLSAAARTMRDHDVGALVVVQDGKPRGILTDRDLVVRGVAVGRDPTGTLVEEVCSTNLVTVSRRESVDEAIQRMLRGNLRRVPVVDDDAVVGIVSLGDIASLGEAGSVLASISASIPNR